MCAYYGCGTGLGVDVRGRRRLLATGMQVCRVGVVVWARGGRGSITVLASSSILSLPLYVVLKYCTRAAVEGLYECVAVR